ncbi:hypothetical protein [Candidatus Electronema sp. PJ]|uniref:hypothetical protein n=1 Tax=Candidatus Electronema sp. PJ TaxID=3401572 RepID=UPI003AA854B8
MDILNEVLDAQKSPGGHPRTAFKRVKTLPEHPKAVHEDTGRDFGRTKAVRERPKAGLEEAGRASERAKAPSARSKPWLKDSQLTLQRPVLALLQQQDIAAAI